MIFFALWSHACMKHVGRCPMFWSTTLPDRLYSPTSPYYPHWESTCVQGSTKGPYMGLAHSGSRKHLCKHYVRLHDALGWSVDVHICETAICCVCTVLHRTLSCAL